MVGHQRDRRLGAEIHIGFIDHNRNVGMGGEQIGDLGPA